MSTIGKALALLDTLSRLDKEAGLTDIARLCALDKATARRFLVELEKHGLHRTAPSNRRPLLHWRVSTVGQRLRSGRSSEEACSDQF